MIITNVTASTGPSTVEVTLVGRHAEDVENAMVAFTNFSDVSLVPTEEYKRLHAELLKLQTNSVAIVNLTAGREALPKLLKELHYFPGKTITINITVRK